MYQFAINRPITTLMGVLSFIIFGLMSYRSMAVDLFPNVDFPVVTIQTAYHGADAGTVETKVTDKIEEAISGIDGIDKLMSTSTEGFSSVTVQFELFKDIDEATNDVRDKIGTVIFDHDIEKPAVKKISAGSSAINLFIATKSGDLSALMRLADEKIKPRLQRVEGVGEVSIIGFQEREIRIFVDPNKLNQYSLTPVDVQQAIASQNVKQGVGKLISNQEEVILKVKGNVLSIDALKGLVIRSGLRLEDIAKVEDGLSDSSSFSSLNGNQGVMLEVKKISGKNTLHIIEGVKEMLPQLQSVAGEMYEMQLLQDQSEKIMVNINNVEFDLIYGSLLAIIIVFFFLRNVTATLVSALAIPTSIIGTFALMDAMGFELNKLTLIGLTLAIGIFIDDAIVVIENITKKLEEGLEPFQASYEGIKEIVFSIVAIAAVLLAVFVPVAFMDGIVGRFFNSFAMTVAAGVVLSSIIAIMLIPSVGARVLSAKESAFFHKTEPFFVALEQGYGRLLRVILHYKWRTLLFAFLFLVASVMLPKGLEFVPMEDNSEFQVFAKAPVGTSLEHMRKQMQPLVDKMNSDENIEYTVLSVGYSSAGEVHKAKIYAKLKPVGKREDSQEEIVKSYTDAFKPIKNMIITVEEVPPFDTGANTSPVQIVVTGDELSVLNEVTQTLMHELEKIEGVINIDRDYESGKPEVAIHILRENMQRSGVSVEQLGGILASAYSSDRAISYYEENGREFDITLRFDDKYRNSIEEIKKLQVKNSQGQLVSLEGLIDFEKSEGLASINRYDTQRKVLVTSGIYGISLDVIMSRVDELMKDILPKGYSYRYTGDIENMADTAAAFGAAVLLAVVLIYLILAALYESLIQPLIIMVAMPLSFAGVFIALFLSGNNLSLFVMMGIILLLGMVGKNSILVVDFANEAIKEGKEVTEAILEAGEKRLRPILMTTFAMIGAMLPLAFGGGAGHESNSPMALAIIGGLVSSTLLTLLVVPAIYRMMYPLDAWLRSWYEKGKV
jgi:HAE1 family hydrophobic/amphiphilic exporter-1